METMQEIRFDGRGGQGVVIASTILAVALFKEGKHVQSFPLFLGERRGAPVVAFTRVSDAPIPVRCQVYQPTHAVVLDSSLLGVPPVIRGLARDGLLLINTDVGPEAFPECESFRIATVNAGALAAKHGLGSRSMPIVNTAMLGALARVSGLIRLESLVEAIRDEVPFQVEKNISAAEEAYSTLRF